MFQYSLGKVLANKLNTPLRLDFSQIGVGGTDHGNSLLNFTLSSGIQIIGLDKPRFKKNTQRLVNSLERRARVIRSIQEKRNHTYQATEAGFDKNVLKVPRGTVIKGYFQSYLYTENSRDLLFEDFQLTDPSNWYQELATEIEATKPRMLHIRRGDYINLKEDFGVLGVEYYSKALAEFEDSFTKEVWVFSDSPSLARELLGKIQSNKFRFIESGPHGSPNESMMLISKGTEIAIANSSFSWWSAYLSQHGTNVFCPNKWFKNRIDPEFLIPPTWKKIESHWE
jgi:hypothetical protein